MRFGTYYFLQGYVVCTSPETIEATALREMPMLNSLLRGPIDQLVRSRDIYVKASEKAGRTGGDALLDELRRTASGPGAPLHGAVRPRGHAALPMTLTSGPSPCRWLS